MHLKLRILLLKRGTGPNEPVLLGLRRGSYAL